MSTPSARASRVWPPIACLLLTSACRDAEKAPAPTLVPIAPSAHGANGCSGPDQAFSAGQMPTALDVPGFAPIPSSHICAARGAEVLYATGADETVVAIDVSTATPMAQTLVAPGTVAGIVTAAGIGIAPLLSGIAVLDASRLVVVERTSNTILCVDRTLPDTVAFFAGQPNTAPGFADGIATGTSGLARFSFVVSTMVVPTGDGRVFVADAGNHAIRSVQGGVVTTIAGQGLAGFADGSLASALFDTPTGVSVLCNLTLLVTERGGTGFGNRLRMLAIEQSTSFFGGLAGTCDTLLGTGTSGTTAGASASAEVAAPEAPFVTSAGEVYWIDSATGVLRRRKADGECDCPLAADCSAAVLTPTFPAGHSFSMTGTDGGKLFVLDATAGTLFRVTP